MDYQPLDMSRDEFRLVYFTQDKDRLTSSGIVELEMRTVSLKDYTSQSREYMASEGVSWYDPNIYSKSIYSFPKTINSDKEQARNFKIADDNFATALNEASFGRWLWGDYRTLSYTWGDMSKRRAIYVNGRAM